MKTLALIIVLAMLLPSVRATAQQITLANTARTTQTTRWPDGATPFPYAPPDKYQYALRKTHTANKLLIAGGICLAVGIPTLIYGILDTQKEDPTGTESSNYRHGMPFVVLGGVATLSGIGLVVPGTILKLSHHRQKKVELE